MVYKTIGLCCFNIFLFMRMKHDFKVLSVRSGYLIGAKGYSIDKYSLDGKRLEHIGNVIDSKYAKLAGCKLTRRLMRAELTGLYTLENGDMIAIGKKGLFLREGSKVSEGFSFDSAQEPVSGSTRSTSSGEPGSPTESGDFHKVFAMPRGSKPLNLCITRNGHIFFGEYFQNMEKVAVNVYGSMDGGRTWKVVYTFPAGNINHVHGLFLDPYTDRIWVLTGDRENESIIGWTDDEFKTLHEELRGGQEYRSCQLFFYKDFIVYATDSQYIENEIRKMDRKTLEITTLAKIQGSVIKGGQCGEVSFLSTTVEPSEVNLEKASHVWVSKDGEHWQDVFSAKKDCWPAILQYGTIEFPDYKEISNELFFSGRAVKGLDGKTTSVTI